MCELSERQLAEGERYLRLWQETSQEMWLVYLEKWLWDYHEALISMARQQLNTQKIR